MSEWQRPASVPFPSIWRKFEGKNMVDGKKRQYWVQDLTDDLLEPAIDYMCTGFMEDEAICKYNKYIEDPNAIEIARQYWKNQAQQKLCLICLTKNDLGRTEIAAVNMTYRSYENEPDEESKIKNHKIDTLTEMIKYIYTKVDVYKTLNIEDQLTAWGLYVVPKYRRDGVGVEMLKSREALCRAVGIPATLTLFTSLTSQAVAKKSGFTELVDVTHDELEKVNPDFVPPGIREAAKSMKYMYIVYN
ncbi:unnamed protein product [Brassicogethes aeneus]|uniref:N-acetyltransferase domain-containing protein n=1 Tax=Brassicogethes aeneus TaxID=1431903 RepID=A0A9P0FKK0_BRAAE|nr:unnamed protein product [Brassicogethes aeneus]